MKFFGEIAKRTSKGWRMTKVHPLTRAIITVHLTKATVVVEGTKNGKDIAMWKGARKKGWRERFKGFAVVRGYYIEEIS